MTNVGRVCGLSLGMYKGVQQGMFSPNQQATIHPKKKKKPTLARMSS
jgi:hypothetical protein